MMQIGSWMQFQDSEGNWFNSPVTLLNDEGDIFSEYGSPNDVRPIPLTKEILLNNGFNEVSENMYAKGLFIVTIDLGRSEAINDVYGNCERVNCHYVHTLQFYYKAIFSKPLNLQL